jgi:hypothetical protein
LCGSKTEQGIIIVLNLYIMENEKDLLEIFQVEELEKRYEMTSWTDDSNTVQAKPVIFDAGETIETNTSAIGGQLTLRF